MQTHVPELLPTSAALSALNAWRCCFSASRRLLHLYTLRPGSLSKTGRTLGRQPVGGWDFIFKLLPSLIMNRPRTTVKQNLHCPSFSYILRKYLKPLDFAWFQLSILWVTQPIQVG